MNIEQYRAIVAQETAQQSATTQTTPQSTPQTTPTQTTQPAQTQPTQTQTQSTPETKIPEKITIEGIGEVPFEELKNGYLRQSDYTKKTQEVAKEKGELKDAVAFYDSVKKNPELLRNIIATNTQVPPRLDPSTAKMLELQDMVFDMKLENEITSLQRKYPDFEVREVLEVAQKKQMNNLEDAYLLNKSMKQMASNPADYEKQMREKIIKELEAERGATQTLISSQGTPVTTINEPKISEQEKKVASMMFRNSKDPYAEYVKWRDVGKKK